MQTEYAPFGLGEQELREAFEKELLLAMRAEGGVPTVHAIAHSFARVVEFDHLRMASQLAAAGIDVAEHDDRPQP